jgi:hypothetical protein
MEMNDSDDVQRLIRLKRYESPSDEYYRSFMDEFKERQRSEMLKQSARGLLFERITMWFEESGGAKRFVPVGALAVASVGAGLYFATAGSGIAPSGSIAGNAAKTEASSDAGYFVSPATGEDTPIELQLPERSGRVPGVPGDRFTAAPGVFPAGARGSLREL